MQWHSCNLCFKCFLGLFTLWITKSDHKCSQEVHLRCRKFTSLSFPDCPCELPAWASAPPLIKNPSEREGEAQDLTCPCYSCEKTFCWFTVCPALVFLQDSLFSFKHCYYSFTHSVLYVLMLQTENSNFHPCTVSLRNILWTGLFVDLRLGVKTLKGTSAGRNILINCSLMHNLKSLLLIQQHVQTGPGFTKITHYSII